MRELAKLTYPQAARALGPRTVAILPVGSTEPHGPHLPLDTDVTIALAQARRAAEMFEADGVPAVVLPPIPYGLTHYTDGFAGRITIQSGTLWALLEDIVTAVEQEGISYVVFVNAHLEPAHVAVLRGVALDHQAHKKGKARVVFADNTRRRWAASLGEEFQSGDCHAGRYETSIVLAADAEHVAEHARLAPVKIDLIEKMKAGVSTFVEAGAKDGYCGDPARASVEEGRELIEQLARMVVTSAREAWPELWGAEPAV